MIGFRERDIKRVIFCVRGIKRERLHIMVLKRQ